MLVVDTLKDDRNMQWFKQELMYDIICAHNHKSSKTQRLDQ